MTKKSKRWSISKRLEFIEFRLYWQGQINRSDLIEKFKISVPQASHDLSEYEETCPRNMQYDARLRAYIPSPAFEPKFYIPSARRYLNDLRALQDGSLGTESSWVGWLPDYAVMPVLRRSLKPEKLQRVLTAMRNKTALRVRYQSFTSEEPTDRWITPHALGWDGTRWIVRSWCHRRRNFRDFFFVRIKSFLSEQSHESIAGKDVWWNTEFNVVLAPNPALPLATRQVLELEFGMRKGKVETTMRACFLYQFERNLLLDEDAEKLPKERRPLIITNRDDLDQKATQLDREAEALNATISSMEVAQREARQAEDHRPSGRRRRSYG